MMVPLLTTGSLELVSATMPVTVPSTWSEDSPHWLLPGCWARVLDASMPTESRLICPDTTPLSPFSVSSSFGAATGALTTLLIVMGLTKIQTGKTVVDLIMVGNGALAGLVSVTGPCGWIEIWAAIPIG